MAATYERRNWIDEAVEYPDRYTMRTMSNNMVTLTPSPGIVDTEGTPQSAVNFNHIECGVLDTNVALSILALHLNIMEDEVNLQETETTPEVGSVTITNSSKFPFGSKVQTVALSAKRSTLNYDVSILEAVASDAKPVGDIVISNKQTNGFGLSYSGSAKSVTIKYRVIGGITV